MQKTSQAAWAFKAAWFHWLQTIRSKSRLLCCAMKQRESKSISFFGSEGLQLYIFLSRPMLSIRMCCRLCLKSTSKMCLSWAIPVLRFFRLSIALRLRSNLKSIQTTPRMSTSAKFLLSKIGIFKSTMMKKNTKLSSILLSLISKTTEESLKEDRSSPIKLLSSPLANKVSLTLNLCQNPSWNMIFNCLSKFTVHPKKSSDQSTSKSSAMPLTL